MLDEGATAPAFSLPGATADGDAVRAYDLDDALDDGPVVLNFYVFDFHPSCLEHLCALHELAWFDLDPDVTTFGISTDRSFSHRAFAESEDLGATLLSDSDGSVAEAYDVIYDEFEGHKRIAKRSVFVIDADRTIRYAWSTDDPSVQPDWSAVRDAISHLADDRMPR
jgi:peroxiredoxin